MKSNLWDDINQARIARFAVDDFPGEMFCVLKDKEIRAFGEFRTRRLVLEAWDELESGGLQ
jgi:hypothetical protein